MYEVKIESKTPNIVHGFKKALFRRISMYTTAQTRRAARSGASEGACYYGLSLQCYFNSSSGMDKK